MNEIKLNSLWSALVGLSLMIALLWMLIAFRLLPSSLVSNEVYQTISEIKYVEVQFLFLLGGDPINVPNVFHGIILNFEDFPVLNILLWGFAGLVAGVFSKSLWRGIGSGISASILSVIFCWFFYWGIIHSFEIGALMSEEMFYLLKLWCIEGLKASIPASIGGAIGGLITEGR